MLRFIYVMGWICPLDSIGHHYGQGVRVGMAFGDRKDEASGVFGVEPISFSPLIT